KTGSGPKSPPPLPPARPLTMSPFQAEMAADANEDPDMIASVAKPASSSTPDPAPTPSRDEEPPPPTVLDHAVTEAKAADWAGRAEALREELDRGAGGDRGRLGLLAYELGELLERRLKDEGAAVKSFGKALQSDPSLRPNLWSIRRVFYR